MDDDQLFAAIADERRVMADLLDTLTESQWATPSLCAGWTVRDVAAHLVMPLITPMPKFALAMAKARGSFDKANIALTGAVARKHGQALPAMLREHADSRFTPPGNGPLAPLTDITVHGQDIRRPLGLTREFDPERMAAILTFLTSPAAQRGFSASKDVTAYRWEATDLDFSVGEGPAVRGPAEALLLVLTGRPVGLADVTGDGADILRARDSAT